MRIQFYSRPNCHLCVEALQTLKLVQEDLEFELEEINIEADDLLHKKYMLMIPVIAYKDKVIQYGKVDYPTIFEALVT